MVDFSFLLIRTYKRLILKVRRHSTTFFNISKVKYISFSNFVIIITNLVDLNLKKKDLILLKLVIFKLKLLTLEYIT